MLDNVVIHADCLSVLKDIPDNYVQLICIDPPYFDILDDDWDNQWNNLEEYISWCLEWTTEARRILKSNGAFYVFQHWKNVAEYTVMAKTVFPYFLNWIAWERIKGRASNTNWKSTKEELLYFGKVASPKFHAQKKIRPVIAPYRDKEGKPKGWYVDEEGNRVRWTGVGNVWHYTPPVWSSKEEPPQHPTQKPLAMTKRIIESSTDPDDIVLDFFAGSGSTLVAARDLGRRFIGVEKDSTHHETCMNRLNLPIKANSPLLHPQ